MIRFHVPGKPAPQGSKRHVGRGIMVESSKSLPAWRAAVTAAAIQARWQCHDAPVVVDLDFAFGRPLSHYGMRGLLPSAPTHKTTKPDVDKLARAVLDALTDARMLRDDSQVVRLITDKRFAAEGDPLGVTITVTRRDA